MIFAFKKSALLYVIPSVIFIAVAVFSIIDMTLLHTEFQKAEQIVLMLSVAVLFVCSRLSLRMRKKLYNESVMLCDTDPDAFFAEQDRIFKKAMGGANKSAVLITKAQGLIAWERLDEAEKLLTDAMRQPYISSSLQRRFLVLSRLVSVKLRKRDISSAREFARQQEGMLDEMKGPGAGNITVYRRAVENNLMLCDFLERLYKNEVIHEDIEKLYADTKSSLAALKEGLWLYTYAYINLNYTLGLLCIARHEEAEASEYFRAAAATDAKYPVCGRIRKYLSDGDFKALIGG